MSPPTAQGGIERDSDFALAPDAATPRRSRRALWLALKLLVSGILISWILASTPLQGIAAAMREAAWPLLVVALGLNFVGNAISVTRWKVLLAAQNIRAGYGYLFQSYVIAIFFSNLLPSTIGGDSVRAYDSWRLGRSKSKALAVIFTDRFLGVLALTVFALAAGLLAQRLAQGVPMLRVWLVLIAGVLAAIVWTLLFAPAWIADRLADLPVPGAAALSRRARKVAAAFSAFSSNPAALRRGFALSLLLQANVVLYYYLIGRALALPVPLHSFFLIVPLSLAVMAIPISINGIGLRENVFAFFFGAYAVSTTEAVAFAWLAYGLSVLHALIGGIVYAARR